MNEAINTFTENTFKDTLDFFQIEPILSSEGGDEEGETGVITREEVKIVRPPLYQVLLHNDDYTTMEFVILVLKKFFGKSTEEATAIMLKVHHDGVGVCAIYTFEVAETKAQRVRSFAKSNGYPLKCSIEKVDDES